MAGWSRTHGLTLQPGPLRTAFLPYPAMESLHFGFGP